MTIRVCIAGATGWAGSSLAKAVAKEPDLQLVGAVSRTHAGKNLGDVLNGAGRDVAVRASAEQALENPCDVFVEYTKPDVAKGNILAAIAHGAHVVVGTSGLTDDDYSEIHGAATKKGVGVLAAGNFSITAVLLQKFAQMAAKHIPYWEIMDYADHEKIDSPSGTACELAHSLSQVRNPKIAVSLEDMHGPRESRGATLNGSQVHAVRLPGFLLSVEAIFGLPDQKLILRHEAGNSSEPYDQGALLAIRKVGSMTGLKRGLDKVMKF
jgi:4-hydroxy-tetrahydrodipicolinate reductase